MTKVAKQFSNPQALSSALAALRTLQPQAFRLLNRLVTLVLASNHYIWYLELKKVETLIYCCMVSKIY